MPLQNRITPAGKIETSDARGLLMGNRGILHDAAGRLGTRRWQHKAWICCVLAFKGRRQTLNAPSHYTQLFFLDEATALAAGHRPCAECRRADYRRFIAAVRSGNGAPGAAPLSAPALDKLLHTARVNSDRSQRTHRAQLGNLPSGAMLRLSSDGENSHLLWDGTLYRWSHYGYVDPSPADKRLEVEVLTPMPIVAALAVGYRPLVHPSIAGFTGDAAQP